MEKNTQADQVINYVYIHVPFCLRKCSYCSFFSVNFSREASSRFVKYLIKEINLFKQKYNIKPKTIYFGGGTPSLLTSEQINLIISQFDIVETEEITLECNPVNIDNKFADSLKTTIINRISLGAQSFMDKELKVLGRLHNAEKIEDSYKILRNHGYTNISLDLIYGLPDQTKKDVEFSLNKIMQLDPEHISTYCLSLEKDVPLFSKITYIPSDEKIAEFYHLIRYKLISAGFDHYEISNFGKSGFESRHNLCYWKDEFYLGFGPSAAGYLNNYYPEPFGTTQDRVSRRINDEENITYRYNNPANIEEYYKMLDKNEIIANKTILNNDDHEKEYIFLGLRKTIGIDLGEFKNIFNTDFMDKYDHVINKFRNLLDIEKDKIKLKPEAYFISDEIFSEFM
ncbi:MAG: radical SAM family heme chaperone HemW [Candidatus Tenebribacter burtonii]|jgi:oxygen-independent coproporphyrinogen-3 oxidase|nr:radical SAM family heme chaperone HemW [Candidatus Tenebribacter burtonii]